MKSYDEVALRIYNRWGDLLYQEEPYANSWDGGNLPRGIYFYEVTLSDDKTCKGWVQLLD